ncbi:hypothetical protein HAX54_005789, partial [Datura stramonium]|nr:hypothetical protein [Datura stramonium]
STREATSHCQCPAFHQRFVGQDHKLPMWRQFRVHLLSSLPEIGGSSAFHSPPPASRWCG